MLIFMIRISLSNAAAKPLRLYTPDGGDDLATHTSALKRQKQSEKRRASNVHIRSSLKTLVKKVRLAVETKDIEKARTALAEAIPAIDKAKSMGVIHRNTASRKVSRLTRLVNSLQSSQ
jgi:small subunit ribosomal protein S20